MKTKTLTAFLLVFAWATIFAAHWFLASAFLLSAGIGFGVVLARIPVHIPPLVNDPRRRG